MTLCIQTLLIQSSNHSIRLTLSLRRIVRPCFEDTPTWMAIAVAAMERVTSQEVALAMTDATLSQRMIDVNRRSNPGTMSDRETYDFILSAVKVKEMNVMDCKGINGEGKCSRKRLTRRSLRFLQCLMIRVFGIGPLFKVVILVTHVIHSMIPTIIHNQIILLGLRTWVVKPTGVKLVVEIKIMEVIERIVLSNSEQCLARIKTSFHQIFRAVSTKHVRTESK
mmetsp:Transcript_33129/g.66857  ORF Transcript_33129/g.66857 Transcript_33129/m.66857 type:complete len:223 (+) Transcript_33129:3-671(+)